MGNDVFNKVKSSESDLCLACGACCTGILFSHVKIGDDTSLCIPEKGFRPKHYADGTSYFALPCSHHKDGACTIYQGRPSKCRDFKCRLIRQVKRDAITVEGAYQAVEDLRDTSGKISKLLNPENNCTVNIRDEIGRYLKMVQRSLQEHGEKGVDCDALALLYRHLTLSAEHFHTSSLLKKYRDLWALIAE